MNVDDDITINKRNDPNDGRDGRIVKIVQRGMNPADFEVSFEGGMERGVYRAVDILPVKPRATPAQQSQTRPIPDIWKGFLGE